MRDFATSESPEVQAQLDRLAALSLPQGRFGLETIRELLTRLGNPQAALPPVFHVAGTNGKGSTCAYLTAILEAQGLRVHSATKPHLVRYNERIRLAGELISDVMLAEVLAEVLDIGEDLGPSFFEVTTAAMFLAFARVPAGACVIEVGLGGRFDATNVIETGASCGIASLGIDHEGFLLRPEEGVPTEPLVRIAFEKASIARAGVPLVTQAYAPDVAAEIARVAATQGAPLFMRDGHWRARATTDGIDYRDAKGDLILPLPVLAGEHQADNAALAVAILRHQDRVPVSEAAIEQGILSARWPARLQELGAGPLTALVPGKRVLLDGGHNADAAWAIARTMAAEAPIALVFAMGASRHIGDFLKPVLPLVSRMQAVPIPHHDAHDPRDIAMLVQGKLGLRECAPAFSVPEALERLAIDPDCPGTVLIAGSLYLAGEVLRLNREIPT